MQNFENLYKSVKIIYFLCFHIFKLLKHKNFDILEKCQLYCFTLGKMTVYCQSRQKFQIFGRKFEIFGEIFEKNSYNFQKSLLLKITENDKYAKFVKNR